MPMRMGLGLGLDLWRGASAPAPSAAATFLARTSGLDGTHTNAYTALINGLVADGTWSLLDALWIFATQDPTTALLNLVSTSFAPTPVNSPTFTIDQGYAGNGTTSYLNSNFTASTQGVQYTLNSASFGIYDRTLLSAATGNQMTSYDGTDLSQITVADTANFFSRINELIGTVEGSNPANTNLGFLAVVRTGAGAAAQFRNGTSAATGTGASTVVPSFPFFIGAQNNIGLAARFSADQLSAAFVGSGSINQANLYSRIQTYMTAVGANI